MQCINMLAGESNFTPMLITPDKYYCIDAKYSCNYYLGELQNLHLRQTSILNIVLDSQLQKMQNLIHKHNIKSTVCGKEHL